MIKKAIFVQVRLNSKRLPEKALAIVNGKTLFEIVLKNLKKIKANLYLVLTDEKSREKLEKIAEKCGFTIFVGPEDDVLKRFTLAIKKYNPKYILRATADNPLVSSDLANLTYKKGVSTDSDYCLVKDIPIGSSVEFVKADALIRAEADSTDSYDREHVCPYIYKNQKKFKVLYLQTPEKFRSSISVTVDTIEDLDMIRDIFSKVRYPNLLKVIKRFK